MKTICIKSFNKTLDYLDDIPNINNGGCGIAAIALYRWLEKNQKLSEDTTIFGFELRYEEYQNNVNLLKDKCNNNLENKLMVSNHYMIFHENKLHDSTGSYISCDDKNISYHYQYEISPEQLLILINKPTLGRGWNSFFNRENVPFIASKLKIDLSDISLETIC